MLTLEGHRNVVYAIAFNNPYGDKIITGSFDKTCKLWNADTGQLLHTYRGHATEIVCLSFNPHGTVIGKLLIIMMGLLFLKQSSFFVILIHSNWFHG